jgi:glyoxylase-like metal-dependent hydrolase (beta-lactamase superfamily II)
MLDFERLVAPNPGPMTLEGTNTYVVGRDPCWVIDPGPDHPGHIELVRAAGEARGGIGGYLLTHGHGDHADGIAALAAPPAPDDAPFERVPTPGHASDHVSFVADRVCFCGDLILGHGSAIVPPAGSGGSLVDYMRSLERLGELDVDLLAPGHGPLIDDPAAKIAEYVEHRRARERALLDALATGERSRAALLDAAWADVPEPMRPAAAMAMQAHLEKLEASGRLDLGELID